ncbi:MAG: PQQ-binding-like beta-propeller repeat protein [Planctomycetales bacterium]|nr:PQQ-binding-like beta-propeller repeat protein [Planctomycetales bacterium]
MPSMNAKKCWRGLHAIVIVSMLVNVATAEDWPCWRGPRHDGISRESISPETWPAAGPAIAWRAMVGIGFSAVSIVADRGYTIGNQENVDTIYCLDSESGRVRWKHSYESALEPKFFEGGPTSTPTVADDTVYVLGRWGDLFAFDAHNGAVRWNINVAREANVRIPGWGFAGSPLVVGDLLLLNVGEAGTAIRRATGEIAWTSADRDAGYATPVPLVRDGRPLAIIASGKSYLAVDVQSGRELWRQRWLVQYGCTAADAIVAGEHVFLSSGYTRGAALLRWTDTQPDVVWKSKLMRNQLNASVLIDEFLYGIDGNDDEETSLKCMEFSTGEVRWSQPGFGLGSLTAAADKLLVLSDEGHLTVVAASPASFQPLAEAKVLDGKCWTAPVLANGRIYVRSASGDIACVDVRRAAQE